MRIAVTGSQGLIGSALVPALVADGHEVVRLVRRAPAASTVPSVEEVQWDPEAGTIDTDHLGAIDGAVHLAGEGVGERRWSDEQKRRIRESRVKGTTTLATALARLEPRPRVLVSGSAIGVYGSRGDEVLTEQSAPGTGFLAEVCAAWEAATAPAEDAGIRVVHVRTGVVLSAKGGALKKQLPLFRFGLGGKLGSGRQWFSWVAIDDEVGAIRHALGNDGVRGPMNATAPAPVTNAEFTKTLARVLRRPAVVPVPKFGLSVVLGGELASELLGSQRVQPDVLESAGYAFRHRHLEDALRSILGRAPASAPS